MKEVENWYDNDYDEWSRLERHRIEFEITKRYLDNYITGEALEIFDIGGGPGRYAFYLAGKGHKVTLLDLSQHNIEVAKEKSKKLGIHLDGYIKGNALELGSYKKKYDVVLLMGPLYHLINEADRRKALEEALKLLKADGIIIAAFISKYAPIQDALSYLRLNEGETEKILGYLEDGKNNGDSGFTTAYFTGIEEVQKLMYDFGLEQLVFAGVENILGSKEKEILSLPEEDIKRWLELGYALSQDTNLMGTSQHFLYIGRK